MLPWPTPTTLGLMTMTKIFDEALFMTVSIVNISLLGYTIIV